MWWLKTPLPGIVWCNCPHMPGFDGLSPEDMVAAEIQGRDRMMALLEFARANLPGFEKAKMLGAAEQIGIRQTRLLQGEYVVTRDDVKNRRYFDDTVCRGRDYYTPYRALLPRVSDNLIVAGRHYSAESEAQKLSAKSRPAGAREAAGVAVIARPRRRPCASPCRCGEDPGADAGARCRPRRPPLRKCAHRTTLRRRLTEGKHHGPST